MRSPLVSVDAAQSHREGSWRSSGLNCVKAANEAEEERGGKGSDGGVLNPKDVI